MRKVLLISALCLALPVSALADNVGNCGWGSKLFDGQGGIAPQVLAVTTNGTSGNQTFAISSGTSGCTQDGVIRSSWRTAAYIDANMNRFAKDVSRGEGESLDSLAQLMDVSEADKRLFNSKLQQNFAAIFPGEDVNSEQVATALRDILAGYSQLARYSANV